MKFKFRSLIPLLAGVALSSGCTQSVGDAKQTVTTSEWKYYSASLVDNGSQAKVEVWTRGLDAVHRYSKDDGYLDDTRCEGGVWSERSFAPFREEGVTRLLYKTIEEKDPVVCFNTATHFLFGVEELLKIGNIKHSDATIVLPDGRTGVRYPATAGGSLVVDPTTGVRLFSTVFSKEGGDYNTQTYQWTAIGEPGQPPAEPVAQWTGWQITRKATLDEVATDFGVASLPADLDGMPVIYTAYFQTQLMPEHGYQIIWGTPKSHVGLSRMSGKFPVGGLGLSKYEFNAQLQGTRNMKLFATDTTLLKKAMDILHPEQFPNITAMDNQGQTSIMAPAPTAESLQVPTTSRFYRATDIKSSTAPIKAIK